MAHEKNRFRQCLPHVVCGAIAVLASCSAAESRGDGPPQELHGLPLRLAEDFERGADRWAPSDGETWRIEEGREGHVFSQFKKDGKYQPPHRSPFNIALLRDLRLGDFVLTAKVKSTIADYDHRDACVVFGYQDDAHFYYVHFGKKADDHANQIFIVDDAPRIKISDKTSEGTPWTDDWHEVKIVRTLKDGAITVYFDDMEMPVMTAKNEKFQHGRVGIGTFDDTSQWDDVRVYANTEEKE